MLMFIVQVSVKQMQDIGVKSGFLTKVGQSVKSWKRRYFIFDGDTLYYFENATSLRQKGEVSVFYIFKFILLERIDI
jgi:hypothetical protein